MYIDFKAIFEIIAYFQKKKIILNTGGNSMKKMFVLKLI